METFLIEWPCLGIFHFWSEGQLNVETKKKENRQKLVKSIGGQTRRTAMDSSKKGN